MIKSPNLRGVEKNLALFADLLDEPSLTSEENVRDVLQMEEFDLGELFSTTFRGTIRQDYARLVVKSPALGTDITYEVTYYPMRAFPVNEVFEHMFKLIEDERYATHRSGNLRKYAPHTRLGGAINGER